MKRIRNEFIYRNETKNVFRKERKTDIRSTSNSEIFFLKIAFAEIRTLDLLIHDLRTDALDRSATVGRQLTLLFDLIVGFELFD